MVKIAGLVILLLGWSTVYAAGEDAERAAKAQVFYEEGMAHFQLEEYPAAVEKWEAGFRIKPAAEFLFNIAQAYRLSRQWEKAHSFYQKFLKLSPRAANRAEVERHITNIEKSIAEAKLIQTAPPADPRPSNTGKNATPVAIEPSIVPSTATGSPESKITSSPPTGTAAAPSSGLAVTSAGSHRPLHKKAWFWGVIGASAAVVIAAVAVGVVFGTRTDGPTTLPMVRF